MLRLTHHDLLNLQEVRCLGGDLLLLPRETDVPYESARALELVGALPPSPSGGKIYSNMEQVLHIKARYDAERTRLGREPGWIADAPMALMRWLRLQFAIQEEAAEIVLDLPYTGISFAIKDDGLHFDLCRACNVWRLSGIRQLGFLQAPSPNHDCLGSQPLSDGTRYLHTTDAMAISTLIAHNLALPESLYNTVRAAAILHDIGTPAGGDSVKLVDVQGLDEDLNFRAILARHEFGPVFERYGIDHDTLCEAILNRGLAGEILDIADKLAYTGRDIHQTRHHISIGARSGVQPGLRTLEQHLERYPEVCSIWDCVVEHDGHAVFTEPARLAAFLRVRALMFRELYYHPRARFAEFLVSRLIVKALFRRKLVTPASLREMTDEELVRLMETEYGTGPYSFGRICDEDTSRVRSFATLEEARGFVATLKEKGTMFAVIDDDRKSIKTGTHLRVVVGGRVSAFSEACPGDAREIQELAQLYPMVRVYYLEGRPDIPDEKLAELIEELAG